MKYSESEAKAIRGVSIVGQKIIVKILIPVFDKICSIKLFKVRCASSVSGFGRAGSTAGHGKNDAGGGIHNRSNRSGYSTGNGIPLVPSNDRQV